MVPPPRAHHHNATNAKQAQVCFLYSVPPPAPAHTPQLSSAYHELANELGTENINVVGNYTLGRVIGQGTFSLSPLDSLLISLQALMARCISPPTGSQAHAPPLKKSQNPLRHTSHASSTTTADSTTRTSSISTRSSRQRPTYGSSPSCAAVANCLIISWNEGGF